MIRTVIIFLALTAAAPAYACKCRSIPFDEAVAGAQFAFEGTARSVKTAERDGVAQMSARVRIHRRLKGPRLTRWVTVWTQGSSAACGYNFQIGQRVVFGVTRAPDGRWSTNSCVMYSLNQPR
jgi:hypothetical protein